MSAAVYPFHFLQPAWLLGLLMLPVLWWLGLRGDASRRALQRLVDAQLLPHLVSGSARQVRWPSGLLALGWCLGVLALAGPSWSRVTEPMFADRAAQVVAISLSERMLARDVPPSRIERARYKARDLLQANKDGLNALIGYAGQSFVVAPLTSDAHSLDALLDAMAPDVMPVQGDNPAQAIEQGAKLIHDGKLGHGSIVLITDDADAAAQAAARAARSSGVLVSVLGIGTVQGAPVQQADGSFARDEQGQIIVASRNDEHLRALAAAGGGRYVPMTADGDDVDALHAPLQSMRGASLAHGRGGDEWEDRGAWLPPPLLLVAALAFRRGWILLLPLVVLPMLPGTARASGWQDWWQRPDQQAASALRHGDAAKAQQLARDPAWRGAASYRAKDYATAVQALQQAHGADAQYNLGNALAQLGRYPEAIKAYDRALQFNPHNEDARVNRKLVQEAMRKSPPPQHSGQNGQQQRDQNGSAQSQHSQGQQGGQTGQSQQSGNQGAQPKGDQDQGAQDRQADAQNGASNAPPAKGEPKQDASRDAAQGATKQAPAPASSSERAQAAKAQQQLQAQMNQALAGTPTKATSAPAHELGQVESDDPLSKLPNDVRRDLQRVPDDPGALLRRKFELEYRQRTSAQPVEGDQP